jgi:hypothetical protein
MARVLWLLASVSCASSPPALHGSWVLQGEEVSGVITGEPAQGCRDGRVLVGLWGPRWGTPGVVPAEVEILGNGAHWLFFSLETGVGLGRAALHLQGTEARLPFGGRPGEFELLLSARPGEMPEELQEQARIQTQAALEEEQEFWAEGSFQIVEDQQVVGDVHFAGSGPTMISVYDTWWLTPEPVPAERQDDGTDMVLAFAAEPSILGETASLRINIPTRRAVVPSDLVPVDGDRLLALIPGGFSAEERDAAMELAIADNRELEARGLVKILTPLASSAMEAGECRSLHTLSSEMRTMLSGYRLEMETVESHCQIHIVPERVQHGRRFSGTIGPKGLVESD